MVEVITECRVLNSKLRLPVRVWSCWENKAGKDSVSSGSKQGSKQG